VRAVVLTGGPPGHPYDVTAGHLADILEDAGYKASVTVDVEGCFSALDGCDLLAVNALRWRMLDDRYAAARAEHAFSPSPEGREAVQGFLRRGGALLASHTAPICFDDWPYWGDIVGAAWRWGESSHPPLGPARVEVRSDAHSITAGVLAEFEVVDEIYGRMDVAPDVEPLAWGTAGDGRHPVVWAREAGGGRVVYDALGHDERSFTVAAHRQILAQAVRWLQEA
jgi:type 1 glutamine amidotransferase